MAQVIVMPKLGNTVESSIILSWNVNVGDAVNEGDILCEIETDKATLEVESTASGILLARFFEENDDVPVLENLAVVGQAGESYDEFMPIISQSEPTSPEIKEVQYIPRPVQQPTLSDKVFISPRAKQLATRKHIDYETLTGTGPDGRIIERDIEAAIANQVKVTPVARAMLDTGEFRVGDELPTGSRIGKQNLVPTDDTVTSADMGQVTEIPLKGVRKTIANRMLESLQTTAQLTLNTYADATAIQAYRKRLKTSDERLGLRRISLNDLVTYAVVKTLPNFPMLNAYYENNTIYQYAPIHLGMAVDTPRGLIVPVIHHAEALSLKQLSAESYRLARACLDRKVKQNELSGGTFTISNMSGMGIESFTPILNLPQVAILGVGSINLKPIQDGDEVKFIPHMSLSLTINHQVMDGALGARFLSQLAKSLTNIDLMLAL